MSASPPIDPSLLLALPNLAASLGDSAGATASHNILNNGSTAGVTGDDASDEAVSKARMAVKAKKHSESRQRKKLEEVLRLGGTQRGGPSPEKRFLSCENCRARKLKCSRHKVCMACQMRGEPFVWKGGAPSMATMTPYAMQQAADANRGEVDRLERLVRLLTARYVKREAAAAEAEGRPPRRPPSMTEVIEAELREELVAGGRARTSPLEDAEALLALATPTVNWEDYGGGMGDIFVHDTEQERRGSPFATLAGLPVQQTAAPEPVVAAPPAPPPARPVLPRSATTSDAHATVLPTLRVSIPSTAARTPSLLSARAPALPSALIRSLTESAPPGYQAIVVDSSFVPVAEHAFPHLPPLQPTPTSFSYVLPAPAMPLPRLRLEPTFFYPLLPSPLMSPRSVAALAETRAYALAAQRAPEVAELRRREHEWRYEEASARKRAREELEQQECDRERGREAVQRARDAAERARIAQEEAGEQAPPIKKANAQPLRDPAPRPAVAKEGAKPDAAQAAASISPATKQPTSSEPVTLPSLSAFAAIAPYQPLAREADPMLALGGTSSGADLVASAVGRRQSSLFSPAGSASSLPSSAGGRPILSLDAAGATSAFSALGSYALLRTPSALSAGVGGLRGRITLSPLRSAFPHSAVEEGLRPINSLRLPGHSGGGEDGSAMDERFEPRAERQRRLSEEEWEKFEPRVEKHEAGAPGAMEVDGEEEEDAGAETDGRSSVARSRRSARSEKGAEDEDDEESEEDETDEASE
ncbi:hypothetical protein JCM10450v2_006090 [Rhodotorula kratochvilovae]